jgi:hypothetical protein
MQQRAGFRCCTQAEQCGAFHEALPFVEAAGVFACKHQVADGLGFVVCGGEVAGTRAGIRALAVGRAAPVLADGQYLATGIASRHAVDVAPRGLSHRRRFGHRAASERPPSGGKHCVNTGLRIRQSPHGLPARPTLLSQSIKSPA